MNENLKEQIRKNLETKNIDELKQIYKEHDEEEWSEESFETIHEILVTRGEIVPHVKNTHTLQMKKNSELNQFLKTFSSKDIPLPKVWPGHLICLAMFFLAVGAVPIIDDLIINGKFPPFDRVPIAIPILALFLTCSITAVLYWFHCVYKIHLILEKMTNNSYPISPWKSVSFHFIPIFTYYWIFKWTKEVTVFSNDKWADSLAYVGKHTVVQKSRIKYLLSINSLLAAIIGTWLSLTGTQWQEGIMIFPIFLFFFYGVLRLVKKRVKEAYILDKWNQNQHSQESMPEEIYGLKQCPSCQAFQDANTRECPNCGYDLTNVQTYSAVGGPKILVSRIRSLTTIPEGTYAAWISGAILGGIILGVFVFLVSSGLSLGFFLFGGLILALACIFGCDRTGRPQIRLIWLIVAVIFALKVYLHLMEGTLLFRNTVELVIETIMLILVACLAAIPIAVSSYGMASLVGKLKKRKII